MKKISIYTKDGLNGSASYYRIIQYFSQNDNVRFNYFIPRVLTKAQYNNVKIKNIKSIAVKLTYHLFVAISSIFYFFRDIILKPETIIILRALESKTYIWPISMFYKHLVMKCKNVIWDFDDDIFVNNEISVKEKELLEKNSNHIITTHNELAKLLSKEVQHKVIIMPTTDGSFENINIQEINNKRLELYEKTFKIVWVTSSSGLSDIPKIEEALDEAAKILNEKYNKELILTVVCNQPYKKKFRYIKVINLEWTRKKGIDEILNAHLGIMPLKDSTFSRGKGGFKLIQYMAAGLPNIGSSVGYNKQVIDNNVSGFLIDDEITSQMWVDKIIELATNKEKWKKMSKETLKRWNHFYSYQENLKTWEKLTE